MFVWLPFLRESRWTKFRKAMRIALLFCFLLQRKCVHECLEEYKPSHPPPNQPGKVADEVSLVCFITILNIFIHSSQTTAWGNLNLPTIPEELSDEEDDPVRPSPGLPRPTFLLSLFHFNSHLSIDACFNRKEHCQTLTYGNFLEFPWEFLFWQLSYVIIA